MKGAFVVAALALSMVSSLVARLPVVLGFYGTDLSKEFVQLIKEYPIRGVILFARNIVKDENGEPDLERLQKLTQDIRSVIPDADILMDQEGGRVQRLKGKEIFDAPAPIRYAEKLEDKSNSPKEVLKLLCQNTHRINQDLLNVGVNVNCTPCCDLLHPNTHSFLHDRTFGSDLKMVVACGLNIIRTMHHDGLIPVCKHVPGHGCATADSHQLLPCAEGSFEELNQQDFEVFRQIAAAVKKENLLPCWCMVSHVVYPCLDRNHPATFSKKVVDFIRSDLGFDSMPVISDCIAMNALPGPLWERAIRVLWAGFDIVLCSHVLDEENINYEEYRRLLVAIERFLRFPEEDLNRLIEELREHFR